MSNPKDIVQMAKDIAKSEPADNPDNRYLGKRCMIQLKTGHIFQCMVSKIENGVMYTDYCDVQNYKENITFIRIM